MVGLLLFAPYVARLQAQITAEQLEKIRGRKMTAAEVREANDLMRKWMRYYDVMDNRRFHIKGEVVDEQGTRLTGVTMWVSKSVSGGWWQNNRDIFRGEFTINGTFDVRESGCESVSIGFEKGGYYRQSIDFFADAKANTREVQDKIMKGLPVEEPMVGKEGLRIVMEKKGEQVHLVEYLDSMEYQIDGRGVILDLSLPTPEAFKKVPNVTDAKQLPAGCVYIIAEKDKTGKISVMDQNKPGQQLRNLIFPTKITMFVNSETENEGFILYEAKNALKPFHEMKLAPETGYQKEITVEPETWIRIMHRIPVPFYFKSNNRYGKGKILDCLIEKGGNSCKFGVVFYLPIKSQGGRNLESIYEL